MEINKTWSVIKNKPFSLGNIKNISKLKATPIEWEKALALSNEMGYEDLFEGLGPQLNNVDDKEFENLRSRWEKYIIIFPGTQCQDTKGNIFTPSIRYVQQMIRLGEVCKSWEFEWFNYQGWKNYQHMGKLGAIGYILDLNNNYDGIAILE